MALQPIDYNRSTRANERIRSMAEITELKARIRMLEKSLNVGIRAQAIGSPPDTMLKSVYDTNVDGLVDNVGLIEPAASEILSLATVNMTANRILTIDVDDGDRTLIIEANTVLNQDYSDDAPIEFLSLTINGSLVITNGQVLQNVTANANIITAGTFAAARIPNLDAGKITTGTFAVARIPVIDFNRTTGATAVWTAGSGETITTQNGLVTSVV